MKHSIFIAIILLLWSCSEKAHEPTVLVESFFFTYEEKGIYNALDNVF